jgi:flavin reductase (DIM6/NTAB) family NADH-FMN oxidoreductase RutF
MRADVELPKSYRLLNHGPTVLVSAAHGGRRNVMAAAWAMPLDFEQRYDLFIGEVIAAQADRRVFSAGRWHFAPEHDALRTLHHIAGGAFFTIGDTLQAGILHARA